MSTCPELSVAPTLRFHVLAAGQDAPFATLTLNVLRHRSYGWVNWKAGLLVRGVPALTARPDGTAGRWLVGSDARGRGITLTSSSTRGRWTVLPGTYLSGAIASYGFV